MAASLCSPWYSLLPLSEALADKYRDEIEREDEHHRGDDRGGGFALEGFAGTERPLVDLNGQHRERIVHALGVECYKGEGPDHDERGGFAGGPRNREDYACHDARNCARQDVIPDRLPLRRTQAERCIADARRNLADRLRGGDDGHGQNHEREREGAGDNRAPEPEGSRED